MGGVSRRTRLYIYRATLFRPREHAKCLYDRRCLPYAAIRSARPRFRGRPSKGEIIVINPLVVSRGAIVAPRFGGWRPVRALLAVTAPRIAV